LHIDSEIKRHQRRIEELLNEKNEGKIYMYTKNPVFRFQCPRCQSNNTKRNGKTTQVNVKARHLCFHCNKFFVLSNNQMYKEILSDSKTSMEEKKILLDKYLITT
jgi:transposase-like protein